MLTGRGKTQRRGVTGRGATVRWGTRKEGQTKWGDRKVVVMRFLSDKKGTRKWWSGRMFSIS